MATKEIVAGSESSSTSDIWLREGLKSVLKDEAFTLPGPSTAAALNTASTLLTWSEDHPDTFLTFAQKLKDSLQVCFKPYRSWKTRKEKLWGTYHSVRTSSEFVKLWTDFLQNSIGHPANTALYQHVTDLVFKEMITVSFQTSSHDSNLQSPSLSHEEESALRYVAGYVCRKVRNKLEATKHPKKDDMILFLMELNGDELDVDDDGGSEAWCNLIDRGGLWHVSDTAYSLFYIIEEEIRQHLTLSSASKQQEGSKEKLIDAVMGNEELLFQWCMFSACERDDLAMSVLRMIVELYVTVRGFAFATSCLEMYKQANKKTSQKSKGIRKELFTSKVF